MTDKPEHMRGTGNTRTRRASNDSPESPRNPPSTSTSDDSTPSLASRVQSSAAGLARSAFQGAGSHDLAHTLTSATNGKAAGPSALSSNTGLSASASHDVSATARNSAAGQQYSGPAVAETFRSGDTASYTQGGFALPALTEDEFQRGETYTNTGVESNETGLGTGKRSHESLQEETGNWKGKQRAHDPVQLEYTTVWERAHPVPSTGTEQLQFQPTDGAAVVSLLSDTSFDPNFDASAENPDLDLAASPPPLNAAEIKMLDSYRRQIGSSGPHPRQGQQLSSLSLVPDIDTFLQQNDLDAFSNTARNTTPANITLRDSVLTHLPGAADWVDVQERYHDEVWGYLRPALEAAKEEIEENEQQHGSDRDGEHGPAVRRLKMILKHMQG